MWDSVCVLWTSMLSVLTTASDHETDSNAHAPLLSQVTLSEGSKQGTRQVADETITSK